MVTRSELGTVAWFKERKRSLLADVRALDDFVTSHGLISRLVEDQGVETNDDVTEQVRGALYMSAVVTYARQFLSSTTRYREKRVYPTRHLKADDRFDTRIHNHLLEVRSKLIAHDDGEQLPPELFVLLVGPDGTDDKPLLATIRSYSLSSAKGVVFLKAIQRHLDGCIEQVRRRLHEGLVEYLVESSNYPDAHKNSSDHVGVKKSRTVTTDGKADQVQTLLNLDELNQEIISVPKGNIHNKAYAYRMLTLSVALPEARFDVAGQDLAIFMGARAPLRETARKKRMPTFIRKFIDWGRQPFGPDE